MPIFAELIKIYSKEKPFIGKKIIIAHVLVPNTIPLMATILSGGGDVTVTESSPAIDQQAVDAMEELGCRVVLHKRTAEEFDYALDIGGLFANSLPRLGVIEVTRSGYYKYNKVADEIVILNTDDSICKLLETFLGNPKSVLKGIEKFLGKNYLSNKAVAILGFGKIGRGIARLFSKYCRVLVLDISESAVNKAKSLKFESIQISTDKIENSSFLTDIDVLISCTGITNVVTDYFVKEKVQHVKIKLNLGAVDEYGSDYNEDEVFMSKDRPFNFNLHPPTENMYIDPILSAQVEALQYLVKHNNLVKGIHPLPSKIDKFLLDKFRIFHPNEEIKDIKTYFDIDEGLIS